MRSVGIAPQEPHVHEFEFVREVTEIGGRVTRYSVCTMCLDWVEGPADQAPIHSRRSDPGNMIGGLRPWNVFGTLIYDLGRDANQPMWDSHEAPRAVSYDRAKKDFLYWVDDASRALGRPIEFVCGVEYQKNGWPHFHTLLDLGELQGGDICKIASRWVGRYGHEHLEIPRSVDDCAAYAARYLVSGVSRGDVLLSKYVSKRLLKSRVHHAKLLSPHR